MELRIFNSLRKLNRRFYDVYADSFSNTRHTIWPGWLRVSDVLEAQGLTEVSLLDVAAGNGRFEAFMAERFPEVTWNAVCIDPCDDLMSKAQGHLTAVGFGNMTCTPLPFDVLDFLLTEAKEDEESLVVQELFDFVTCFGFMHHVYSTEIREELMDLLVDQAKPDGLVALSFWRFASDEDFAQKAEEQTQAALESEAARSLLGPAALMHREPGDYLLGWQGNTNLPRYCHSFTEDEITHLIESVADRADLIDRFAADGRTGTMNEYVVLRVR